MGERLRTTLSTLSFEQVVDGLGLDLVETKAAIWNAGISKPAERTNLSIRAVLEYVPFRIPLIEARELKQPGGQQMYEAADGVLEDTICVSASEPPAAASCYRKRNCRGAVRFSHQSDAWDW